MNSLKYFVGTNGVSRKCPQSHVGYDSIARKRDEQSNPSGTLLKLLDGFTAVRLASSFGMAYTLESAHIRLLSLARALNSLSSAEMA